MREDVPGVQQLVGYVVPSSEVDQDRLRSLLRNRLPSYMVPALIETVADLPRLPSGKLDRAALPPPRLRNVDFNPKRGVHASALENRDIYG